MPYHFSYLIEQRLKSLSERAKYLAANTNAHLKYNNPVIKGENLKFNLSLILTRIILELNFINREKSDFEKVINDYNLSNQTSLSFSDFENLGWIRIIDEKILIATSLTDYLWKIDYDEKKGESVEIDTESFDLIRCLQSYYEKYFQEAKLSITKEKLQEILNKYASNEIGIPYLTSMNIVVWNDEKQIFLWTGNEYSTHLKNEIAATLWLLTGALNHTLENFKIFIRLIYGAEIFVDNLKEFLSRNQIDKIVEFGISFLKEQNDLIRSDNEFIKIFLDSHNIKRRPVTKEIPDIKFDYDNPIAYIDDIIYYDWRYQELFYFQPSRGIFDLVIHIIVQNDELKNPVPYHHVLEFLKDTSRPYIIYRLFTDIPKEYPEIIPYLILEPKLITIAFRQVDKLEFISDLVGDSYGMERKVQEVNNLRNELYLELFDLVLIEFSSGGIDNKEAGERIAEILIDISEKVFSLNVQDRDFIFKHNAFRSRYEKILNKLKNKRVQIEGSYGHNQIAPRIIFFMLPHIFIRLLSFYNKPLINTNRYIRLPIAFIDICIEILRLCNLEVDETEISVEDILDVNSVTIKLTNLIKDCLLNYYFTDFIDVTDHYSNDVKKEKGHRLNNEFAFEILDWSYLFLQFQKHKILQKYLLEFQNSITFNVLEDEYHDHNREQIYKVKVHLKSILVAYISINKNKIVYEIEGFPVNYTLRTLEKQIKEISLKYSLNDLANGSMDVFDDRLTSVLYNLYYHSVSNLLYSSMNYFDTASSEKFIEDYFAGNNHTGKMLAAINLIDDHKIKNIIATRIEQVDIGKFIDSRFGITELLHASIEAINSESHWKLAKPLIERVQKYVERISHRDENTANILYEINLLLAYKERDYAKLISITHSKPAFQRPEVIKSEIHLKDFFIAIYKLNHNKEYDDAIKILNSLLAQDNKNVRYAFQLYRAQTFKALN